VSSCGLTFSARNRGVQKVGYLLCNYATLRGLELRTCVAPKVPIWITTRVKHRMAANPEIKPTLVAPYFGG
jgi:hypothetical protein